MSTPRAISLAAEAHLRHARYFTIMAIEADSMYERGESRDADSLQRIEADWDNIELAQRWCATTIEQSDEAPRLLLGLLVGTNDYLKSRGRIDIQKRWIDDALHAAEVLKENSYRCDIMSCLGNYYHDRGAFEKALEIAQQTVEMSDTLPKPSRRAVCYNNLANAYLALHKLDDASRMFERSLEVASGIEGAETVMNSHHGLAIVHRLSGDSERELLHNGLALEAAHREGARRHEQSILHERGLWLLNHGQPKEAWRVGTEALQLARAFSDRKGEILLLQLLGMVRNSVGEAAAAIELFDQCLSLLADQAAPQLEAMVLVNKASALERLRRFGEAAVCSERSLELRRAAHDVRGEANSLNAWGSALQNGGSLREARQKFLEALKFARLCGSKPELGRSLLNLGSSTGILGNPAGAIQFLRESLAIFRSSGETAGQMNALLNLVQAHQELRLLPEAKAYLDLALPLLQQAGDPRLLAARAMLRQWDYVEAADITDRGSSITKSVDCG